MAGTWMVMHVSTGKTQPIAKAAGPECPGAVLRVEDKEYEVVFSEGNSSTGWIYVTNLCVTRRPAAL